MATTLHHALVLYVALVVAGAGARAAPGTGSAWLMNSAEIERESATSQEQYQQVPYSGRSSHMFSRNNGRQMAANLDGQDFFHCVNPTKAIYRNFVEQYNRTFSDATEELERYQLFYVTMKRAIVLNRVIQHNVLSANNIDARNFHFIEPLENQNLALWFADVTDCELSLIKNFILDIIRRFDENQPCYALPNARRQPELDLPGLLNQDVMEQMVDIMLVRLFDRLTNDSNMNRLFEWPVYFKRLASFVYSKQQAEQPDFKTKLSMVAFAYPAYFKDLKYNRFAVNRTHDNLQAHQAHMSFNEHQQRRPMALRMQNKRLSIFRQRWSLINQLNELIPCADENGTRLGFQPDWVQETTVPQRSLSLRAPDSYKLTRFSDLTDVEFQAYLSNDYSLLQGNKESAEYLEQNFRVVWLSEAFRQELAHELELRHGLQVGGKTLELLNLREQLQQQQQFQEVSSERPSLVIARKVVDELIGDVGLPIGPEALEGVTEEELLNEFRILSNFFSKTYATASTLEALEERRLRLGHFKENYPRFMAWFIREGWNLTGEQKTAMLRLADMSWLEIKLTMFKICCLTKENLEELGKSNATLRYLSSNYDLLCGSAGSVDLNEFERIQASRLQQQHIAGEIDKEIYYYYLVHFNKHRQYHTDEFNRSFGIFRRNIESIRRQSCRRSLTLFEGLKSKQTERLNTIDVLDPRRSRSDDLNLDRYEYFRLPRPDLLTVPSQQRAELSSHPDGSRASISYSRGPFYTLLNREHRPSAGGLPAEAKSFYANKLVDSWESVNEATEKYRENQVARIYNLVMDRYQFCMRATHQRVELGAQGLRQYCQANGRLSDQAAMLGGDLFGRSEQTRRFERLVQEPAMSCDKTYFLGLDSFNSGLMAQDPQSIQSIQSAVCA